MVPNRPAAASCATRAARNGDPHETNTADITHLLLWHRPPRRTDCAWGVNAKFGATKRPALPPGRSWTPYLSTARFGCRAPTRHAAPYQHSWVVLADGRGLGADPGSTVGGQIVLVGDAAGRGQRLPARRSLHGVRLGQTRVTAPAQTHTSCWWGGTPNLTRTALLVQAIAWACTSSSTPSSHSTQACTRCGTAGVQTVNCPICSGSRLRGSRWARRGRSVMLQSIEQVFWYQGRLG